MDDARAPLADAAANDTALGRLLDEQTALRRIATLVATGASDTDLVTAVTSEIAHLFEAQRANAMRWEGDTIRVIGDWSSDGGFGTVTGRTYSFGGDTITARIVESAAPARVESSADLHTDFARARWSELGIEASIGAPIVVDGRVWGCITASRTKPGDPFPPGAEHKLGDFAALVAQAIANSETQREVAALVDEQTALRQVATLVAGGRPQEDVLDAATREAGRIFGARGVYFVRWEGVLDEVVVHGAWNGGMERPPVVGDLYHPAPGGPTLRVLEEGFASRGNERSPELGEHSVIGAPVITTASLVGALIAVRPLGSPFPSGAEIRLRSFADLVAQSMANALAQAEMRASRARIVRAADEARRKLERDLHDGAQQRLVSVLLSLRVALAVPVDSPERAREVLAAAAEELAVAIDELRDLARGIHPSTLTEQGLGPALEQLARRAPLPVAVRNEVDERLPGSVEAAAYYVVAESLTNIAKYAGASAVEVCVSRRNDHARVDVVDDGVGGADFSAGSGLRGLADRVEALDGRFGVESPVASGTRVWAEIPLTD